MANNGRPGSGRLYTDPMYDGIEAGIEKELGLPAGGLKAIRTKGERSNADQVSSANAKSVYQIIPATRDAFLKQYGVDAYASPASAARVAGLHLRDSLRRNGGDWPAAVAGYHGGIAAEKGDGGPVNRAYVRRVTGKGLTVAAGDNGATMLAPGAEVYGAGLLDFSMSDFGSRKPVGPAPKDPEATPEARKEKHIAALTGGVGVLAPAPVVNTPDLSADLAAAAADKAAQSEKSRYGFVDRAKAAIEDGHYIPAFLRGLEQAHTEGDPSFYSDYLAHWQDIEGFAQTPRERSQLREAESWDDLHAIQQHIQRQRVRDKIIDSNGTGAWFRLGAGITDPAGWLAGLGVGKVVQGFGIGSRLIASGVEGMAGNLVMTAALDAAGEHTEGSDYLMSSVSGLTIGAGLHPFTRGTYVDREVAQHAAGMIAAERAGAATRRERAIAAIGPDASPGQIRAKETELVDADMRDWLDKSLTPVPDELRLLSPENMLTGDPAARAHVEQAHGLASVSDDAERGMIAEHIARGEAIARAIPVDPAATQTILSKAGWESTGLRLLASESPLTRAVGSVLVETTTGAAGRRRTAAMMQAVRERLYLRQMVEYDGLYQQFRKGQGVSRVREMWDAAARRDFDQRVYAEVEARAGQPDGFHADTNPAVTRAADLWESGMDLMRREQQHVGVIGAQRLGDTSQGYMTHRLDPAKVLALTPDQQTRVRDVLKGQFMELNSYATAGGRQNFDEAFSAKLAAKYLEVARLRAMGQHEVPFGLHSPEAAEIVRDSLQALNLPAAEVDALIGRFSRGGAGHTKGRLRLDLQADIGDGMKLQDLFVTDVANLYRAYSRRVSGEVALAQFGIMGKKGLDVLRTAMQANGANVPELEAFDQIAAELLNTPYGTHNSVWMDNVRTLTSASRLGGMAYTQVAEYGNGLAAVGIGRVFSAIGGIKGMSEDVARLAKGGRTGNPILADIDTLGGPIGLDDYQMTRAFDIKDNAIQLYGKERLGVVSKAIRLAGHAQVMASGHRRIVAIQTRGMAEQIVRKAVCYIRAGKEDKALADMGFTPELRAAIAENMDSIAKFGGKGRLLELNLRSGALDGQNMMLLRDAVERGASQIIQRTYIGETGKWAHDGLLKLLLQFRTFSLTSVEKQWGRSVRNYGAVHAFTSLMGAMSFALPIYLARVQMATLGMSEAKRAEHLDRTLTPFAMARATLNYASASGILGDVLDLSTGFASDFGMIDPDLAPNTGAKRNAGGNGLIGGVVAPGVGLVEDIWKGTHGDGKRLIKAMPGANLPYVHPLITGVTSE